jgi:hypothetical protein
VVPIFDEQLVDEKPPISPLIATADSAQVLHGLPVRTQALSADRGEDPRWRNTLLPAHRRIHSSPRGVGAGPWCACGVEGRRPGFLVPHIGMRWPRWGNSFPDFGGELPPSPCEVVVEGPVCPAPLASDTCRATDVRVP